ncbi:hypothetical protein MY4824_002285 [Beauveria thailandica]
MSLPDTQFGPVLVHIQPAFPPALARDPEQLVRENDLMIHRERSIVPPFPSHRRLQAHRRVQQRDDGRVRRGCRAALRGAAARQREALGNLDAGDEIERRPRLKAVVYRGLHPGRLQQHLQAVVAGVAFEELGAERRHRVLDILAAGQLAAHLGPNYLEHLRTGRQAPLVLGSVGKHKVPCDRGRHLGPLVRRQLAKHAMRGEGISKQRAQAYGAARRKVQAWGEHRLATHQHTFSVILNLLCLLDDLIGRCQREGIPPEDEMLAEEEGLNNPSEQPLRQSRSLEDSKSDVEAIMEQLVRISTAIRRSGVQTRLERADNTFSPDRHGELTNHLVALIRTGNLTREKKQGPPNTWLDSAAPALTEIQERLIEVNLKRRHRFLYANRRWHKQAQERDQLVIETHKSDSSPQLPRSTWTADYEKPNSIAYWLCFACPEPMKFCEEGGFTRHLQTEHDDTISADQIPMVVNACMCNAPMTLSSCPLCAQSASDDEDPEVLLAHVAQHIHSFALESLPWPVPGEVEAEFLEADVAGLQKVSSFALSSYSGDSSHTQYSLSTDREKDFTGDYFSNLDFQDERPEYPNDSAIVLNALVEKLNKYMKNWYGLNLTKFGHPRIHGTIDPLAGVGSSQPSTQFSLKGAIKIKKLLSDIFETGDTKENILTLKLALPAVPEFHLRFRQHSELNRWSQELLYLEINEGFRVQNLEHELSNQEIPIVTKLPQQHMVNSSDSRQRDSPEPSFIFRGFVRKVSPSV